MAADKNWARWLYASMSHHFSERLAPIPFITEGEDQAKQRQQDYVEFRMNGPICTEISKDFWRVEVVVNLLFVCKRSDKNTYKIYQNSGIGLAAFIKAISAKKYGNGLEDTQETFGCLIRATHNGEEVEVINLGQVGADVFEMQSMVQGYYRMLVET